MPPIVTFEQFRVRMNEYRDRLVHSAMREKEMNLVPIELEKQYERLGDDERFLADQVVCEWLLSDDPGIRWDAEFLIKKFKIRFAASGLKDLESRLMRTFSISAPDRDELVKVQKLLEMIEV